MKNILRKFLVTSILLPPMISVPAIVQAYQETISVYGEYVLEPFENPNVARERALADAMNLAAMKAGVYVKNLSTAEDRATAEEIIELITGTVSRIQGQPRYEIVHENDLDLTIVRCYITAIVDNDNVIAAFNKDQQENPEAVRKNREYLENNRQIIEEYVDLKSQYENATTDSERQQILAQMEENDREFTALVNGYFLAENKLYYDQKYSEASE